MNQSVQRRAVFFIGGYDPKTPDAFFKRLRKEISRFDTLWGYQSTVSTVDDTPDHEIGLATIETRAAREDWSTTTHFNFLALDSIVLADFARPLPVRLGKYLRAFADFVFSGTAFHFFSKAWRFGLYFLYPFLAIVLFALLGLAAARLTAHWLGTLSWIIGLIVFSVALMVLGKRWSTNHLMDLWSFSLNFFRGRRPDAETLMQRFAEGIVQRVSAGKYDEVILIGHSTGGMLMLDVAARCLALDSTFSTRAPKVTILTLGSTALKAGYHPAATKFREAVQRLTDDGKLEWAEIQCLTDAINFYKTDPVAEMKLKRDEGRRFPFVRQVRVKDMLQAETYKRVKRNLFRVHYQYVFGNTKPYWYDFFQVCCGPNYLSERVSDHIVGGLSPEKVASE
ncbi:lipase [Brucella haematophila]|uniref:lipase n=1 Tax=Brucella haematophila TaxID=419474 RepID=UPI00110D8496|nr:lipase [Brucella haematophila]TMV06020.1 lipase [Brucella haematophila]